MKFESAYQTTACSGFPVDKLRHQIEVAASSLGYNAAAPIEIRHSMTGVDSFAHPFFFKNTHGEHVAVDTRPYTRADGIGSEQVKNGVEYEQVMRTARLTKQWVEASSNIRGLGTVPIRIYATLLSELMERHLGLEALDKYRLYMAFGHYYMTLFDNAGKVESHEWPAMAKYLGTALKVQATDMIEIMEHYAANPVSDIVSFCADLPKLFESDRVTRISPAFLFASLSNTWFGNNAKEEMAVAVEHPPTFIALAYTALNSTPMKNTGLARVANRVVGLQERLSFSKAVEHATSDTPEAHRW